MLQMTSRRCRLGVVPLVVIAGSVGLPGVASAATASTYHRYEVIAQSRYASTEPCPEGSAVPTSQTTVFVTAGHEEESENRVTTVDNDYLRFEIHVAACDGTFTTDSALSGPGDNEAFTYDRSLSTTAVTGTLATVAGEVVTVDLHWTGLGKKPVTDRSKTTDPGFAAVFVGKQRDAVANGTVVYADETVADRPTANADLESFEDASVTR